MKSTYEFVADTAKKHSEGRKVIIWGSPNEMLHSLLKAGIPSDRVIALDDGSENALGIYANKKDNYYIIAGGCERNERSRRILEKLGYKEVNDFMFVHGIKRFVTQEMYVNVKETDTMNVLGYTSLGRMPFVMPHIQMLSDKHPRKRIRFYLMYHVSAVPDTREAFNRISRYVTAYENVELYGIPVGEEDDKLRELLDKYIGLLNWETQNSFNLGGGAYYYFLAHKYLPKELDRILYIDIGDTVINDSIAPFYYEDFEGKSMIVTIGYESRLRDKNGHLRPFNLEDCENPSYLKMIAHESFNGGVKLINLKKLRRLNFSIDDYIEFAKEVQEKYHLGKYLFYDQGLLGMMFLGDIKFYKMSEFDDEKFMPFNQPAYLFTQQDGSFIDTYYEPAIVHFCGPRSRKPFVVKYPRYLECFQDGVNPGKGNGNADKFYFQWYDAALRAENIMKKVDKNFIFDESWNVCNIRKLDEYLHYVEVLAEKYLVCIGIIDTAGKGLSDYMARKLTAIGLADLRQEARWSYAFVQLKGKILLNKLNGFESITEECIVCEDHTIELISKAFNKGFFSKISIDGIDYAVNCRGLNIVIFDLDNGRLVDTVGFDTVFDSNPCYRKSEMFYAVCGYSSQFQEFHDIALALSNGKYTDVINECKEIIRRTECYN